MNRNVIINRLRDREPELRELGVVSLSLFGSAARGDGNQSSDIDLAVRFDPDRTPQGLDYFEFLDGLQQRLEKALGRRVDLVSEPARKARFQAEIDRDRVLAF
jgi:predicted nucleotidyltransferase